MNDFVINIFIPPTQTGSAVAVLAYLVAEAHHGSVVVNRCLDDAAANHKIQELLHHITIAVGYGAPLPKHQEIWYCSFSLSQMIQDELEWFANKTERSVHKNPHKLWCLQTFPHLSILNTRSIGNFLHTIERAKEGEKNNVGLLYDMLDDDEFEHLMAYLLREHPNCKDVTTEDYVLSLFVEHAKKEKTP